MTSVIYQLAGGEATRSGSSEPILIWRKLVTPGKELLENNMAASSSQTPKRRLNDNEGDDMDSNWSTAHCCPKFNTLGKKQRYYARARKSPHK